MQVLAGFARPSRVRSVWVLDPTCGHWKPMAKSGSLRRALVGLSLLAVDQEAVPKTPKAVG